jgi:predicted O-methyltransferase YrrM
MAKIDFNQIKAACDGMMRPEVYEAIYKTAIDAPPGDFVEVGTAHGASTVCLALAIKERGTGRKVYTFDRHAAGSRTKYGDPAANVRITNESFARFGVSEIVEMIVGDVAETASQVPPGPLSLLMIDADGQVDRDMKLFGDRLGPGMKVIIDDYANRGRCRNVKTHFRIDQKHRITYHLTNAYEAAQVIEQTSKVNETWFGVKGLANVADVSDDAIISAYRKLIFTDVNLV